MSRVLVVSLFAALVFTQGVFASEWKSIHLRSAEGVSIVLDYQVARIENGRASHHTVAAPWVNIRGLSPSDSVRVILMSFDTRNQEFYHSAQGDLWFVDGHFTGQLAPVAMARFECGSPVYAEYNRTWYCERGSERFSIYRQELAIQVNGRRYLVDPISRSHNFKFSL
ncbi:MAG: hypothetical protein A2X94_16260 [Bdellovibrionales bacterium GWB1_55_8]|nr:MAG: hypothetical protein A2X94_16260 [Bdellovibrionales bacterium GWB1_55_8]